MRERVGGSGEGGLNRFRAVSRFRDRDAEEVEHTVKPLLQREKVKIGISITSKKKP
jgi:hypothetical protein